ncbi:MAG: hypothetical protein BWY47_00975 [Bacteroidetes bacterium ADurb.Bin302]|nr:MAG: hypothetical protein BWY47_00975 [Bacteroidetes bacterium ADurb.Bin302]
MNAHYIVNTYKSYFILIIRLYTRSKQLKSSFFLLLIILFNGISIIYAMNKHGINIYESNFMQLFMVIFCCNFGTANIIPFLGTLIAMLSRSIDGIFCIEKNSILHISSSLYIIGFAICFSFCIILYIIFHSPIFLIAFFTNCGFIAFLNCISMSWHKMPIDIMNKQAKINGNLGKSLLIYIASLFIYVIYTALLLSPLNKLYIIGSIVVFNTIFIVLSPKWIVHSVNRFLRNKQNTLLRFRSIN